MKEAPPTSCYLFLDGRVTKRAEGLCFPDMLYNGLCPTSRVNHHLLKSESTSTTLITRDRYEEHIPLFVSSPVVTFTLYRSSAKPY